TRSQRDWSSDVCSSDLAVAVNPDCWNIVRVPVKTAEGAGGRRSAATSTGWPSSRHAPWSNAHSTALRRRGTPSPEPVAPIVPPAEQAYGESTRTHPLLGSGWTHTKECHGSLLSTRYRRFARHVQAALRELHRRRVGAAEGRQLLREHHSRDRSGLHRDPQLHRRGCRDRPRRGLGCGTVLGQD